MKERNQLISRDYLSLQRELHSRPQGYGGKGDKWSDSVVELVRSLGASSVLDYGCGQGSLARALREASIDGLRIAEYDPAIEGKDGMPAFADLVVCTDVLEHIEPDRLSEVLDHLRRLARMAVFVVISTRLANKIMRDGRNAHLIVETGEWWHARMVEAGFSAIEPGPKARQGKPAREWVAVLRP